MDCALMKKIKTSDKYAFVSTFVFGLIAHFYRMTNWLPNWDSLVFRADTQHMESLGRWFLPYASLISTEYELPWLNGLLALLYLSVAAVFVSRIFDMENKVAVCLLGGITAAFPTVTSTFTNCYVADAYALSFLFACIAAYLLAKKSRIEAIFAAVLITLSMGIYQAYVTVTVSLLLCFLIINLLSGKKDAASAVKSGAKYFLCGAAAFLMYYIVQKTVTAVMHIEASDYQEFSQTLLFREIDILSAIPASLYLFIHFFADFSKGFNLYSAVNVLVFLFLAAGYLTVMIKNLRGAGKIILTVVLILCIPFGCTALYFANINIDYHCLMKMGFFIVYVYLILLFEKFDFVKLDTVKKWGITALCGLLIFLNIRTANVTYHKLQISFEKSYGILIRIADRMESLDGFENAEKILVVGELENSKAYSVDFPPEITGTTDGLIIRKDDETVHQSVLSAALKDYCDIELDFLFGQEAKDVGESERVKNMPCWPARDSVAIFENTVIVKLSDGEEK